MSTEASDNEETSGGPASGIPGGYDEYSQLTEEFADLSVNDINNDHHTSSPSQHSQHLPEHSADDGTFYPSLADHSLLQGASSPHQANSPSSSSSQHHLDSLAPNSNPYTYKMVDNVGFSTSNSALHLPTALKLKGEENFKVWKEAMINLAKIND